MRSFQFRCFNVCMYSYKCKTIHFGIVCIILKFNLRSHLNLCEDISEFIDGSLLGKWIVICLIMA